jgi:hypothetical protein
MNLSRVDSLLSLPCVIDVSKCVMTLPIFSKALSNESGVFIHRIGPGESLSEFLYRLYDGDEHYYMDCSIYAQLASLVLTESWPGDWLKYLGGGDITLYLPHQAGPTLWRTKPIQMGYIGIVDCQILEQLSLLPIAFKGEWVVRTGENKFLGLSEDGPLPMSIEDWVQYIRSKLEKYSYIDESCTNQPPEYFQKLLVRSYFERGDKDRWGFYSQPTHPSITVLWTSDKIMITDNEI